MKRKKIWIIVPIVCVAIGMTLYLKFYPRKTGPWKRVTIATATPGGTYYLLGDELALILEQLGGPIEEALLMPTDGSVENIKLVMDRQADVAFTMASDLLRVDPNYPEKQRELRILARLYKDVMQIVVRKDANIETIDNFKKFFEENKDKKIFIGPEDSGTREIAKQILKTVWLSEESYTTDDANTFAEAAKRLKDDKLDAAFFMAGMPTVAVKTALESGECELFGLDRDTIKLLAESSPEIGLVECNIPANLYRNQPDLVQTVASDVFLVCRKDLPKDLAFVIIEALFDNIEGLLFAHAKAQEIRLTEAFDVPKGFELHQGAEEFRKNEEQKLLIATGALDGKYYHLGKAIQDILEPWGISARAIQTDGSLENAGLLNRKDRHVIAIMQYDAALACFGKPSFYSAANTDEIPQIRNIRRIAALHEEKLHVVVRRKKLEQIERELGNKKIIRLDKLRDALLNSEEKISVCLGPEGSATQLVARTILNNHKIKKPLIECRFLPVSEMVNQLDSEEGELDMGFFVSYVPSKAMRNILDSNEVRLLSLGYRERKRMAGAVFKEVRIDPNMYGCQQEDEGSIETLATQAVLVATENLPSDVVKTITKAIFKNIAFLDIENLTEQGMANLPTIPLHPGAEQYYKEAELLLSEPPLLHRLQWMWYILGCLTMLITVMFIPAYTGLIVLRRSRAANEIGRRVLAIPLEASARDSVERLLKIRDEIQQRVRRRWWKWGELDKHRWRYLRDLIHDRIGEAKENLTRAFVAEIRDVMADVELDETTRQQRCRSIESRIWEYFQRGELDPSQQKILRELLRESRQQDTKPEEAKSDQK